VPVHGARQAAVATMEPSSRHGCAADQTGGLAWDS
jgi:hypothetical protein